MRGQLCEVCPGAMNTVVIGLAAFEIAGAKETCLQSEAGPVTEHC